MGNYDGSQIPIALTLVIPLREKMGNYDSDRERYVKWQLYHYERKWGTMVFAPIPKNDFPHIISPFSVCVNPQTEGAGVAQTEGAGVAGCPGGFGIYLTKGETLGKLELHKT